MFGVAAKASFQTSRDHSQLGICLSGNLTMPIIRRDFIRFFSLGCACCLADRALAAADQHSAASGHAAPHWSYQGSAGPDHWGELQPDFKVCQLGLEQTPIDLSGGTPGDTGAVALDYRPLPRRTPHDGQTPRVPAAPVRSARLRARPLSGRQALN
jgi:carbonic anhydrase